jgi:hypothetical protein
MRARVSGMDAVRVQPGLLGARSSAGRDGRRNHVDGRVVLRHTYDDSNADPWFQTHMFFGGPGLRLSELLLTLL